MSCKLSAPSQNVGNNIWKHVERMKGQKLHLCRAASCKTHAQSLSLLFKHTCTEDHRHCCSCNWDTYWILKKVITFKTLSYLESRSLSSLWPPFCLQDKHAFITAWLVDLAWGNNNNHSTVNREVQWAPGLDCMSCLDNKIISTSVRC